MAFTTVIHLQFGEKYLNSALEFFLNFRNQYLDQKDFKIIIVDNNPSSTIFKNNKYSHIPGLYVVSGDNTFREFSGWNAGLRFLRDILGVVDSNIIFSNDTMLEHRAFDESLKNAFYLGFQEAFSLDIPVMIGDVDLLASEPPSSAFVTEKYLSTYLFAVNLEAAKSIETLIFLSNIFDYFEYFENEFSVFSGTSDLNSGYIEAIECWLYKKSKKKKWYGHSRLTLINFHSMKSKAMSILLEHFLSNALIKKGIIMVDIKSYLRRNSIQKFTFFCARKNYSIKWRLRKYSKGLIS